MIVLFTDFGMQGPYVGQMKAVLQQHAPQQAVIDLMHDAPAFNPKASAYLLNVLRLQFPVNSIFLGVIDPGVGSIERRPVIVQADEQWFIGPDNGLFEIIVRNATQIKIWEIIWRPAKLSTSFHGRDLFAPIAAAIAAGTIPESLAQSIAALSGSYWPDELAEIIYIDHYGNAITGLSASALAVSDQIIIDGKPLSFSRVFSDVPNGEAFWYVNSIGLIELAVNQGNFYKQYRKDVGMQLLIKKQSG